MRIRGFVLSLTEAVGYAEKVMWWCWKNKTKLYADTFAGEKYDNNDYGKVALFNLTKELENL